MMGSRSSATDLGQVSFPEPQILIWLGSGEGGRL